MHKEDIKAEIRKRAGTMENFAELVGVSPSDVRCAVMRPRPKVDILICEYIGVPPAVAFPDRYGPKGSRTRQLSRILEQRKLDAARKSKAILAEGEDRA